ncbi:MAG: epoxyqueuosine reductase QueH [Anaerococcus sp.]|nr:epoxyqueuosine reductase QueH [Anaerococcus sp.]
MQKINYNLKMEEIIKENKKKGLRPKLLLQVCCAPCSTAVVERLREDFAIDMFYYNPNIYPESEIGKRVETLRNFKSDFNLSGSIILPENDKKDFAKVLALRKDDKEGGRACFECYRLRLEETAKYAKENSYDYFSTTLSISPHKNSQWLNEIGRNLEEKYQIAYLYSDFKKKNGYKRSIDLSKEYDLYRQDYCGCIFSYKEMLDRKKEI